LRGNHSEVDRLMSLIRKGDDVSLAVLEKMKAVPWKARPPNARTIINRCEERDDPWEDIPQEEDCALEMLDDTSQTDDHRAAPHAPMQTQSRRQRDLPVWQDIIESSLEELTRTYQDCTKERTSTLKTSLAQERTTHRKLLSSCTH
jgi:hypothetical protein